MVISISSKASVLPPGKENEDNSAGILLHSRRLSPSCCSARSVGRWCSFAKTRREGVVPILPSLRLQPSFSGKPKIGQHLRRTMVTEIYRRLTDTAAVNGFRDYICFE